MDTDLVVNLLGWAGALAVLTAYGLLSLGRWEGKSPIYQALNLTGSVCLIVNTLYYGAYPSTFVNVVWMAIAGIALFGIWKGRIIRDAR